MGMRGGLFPAQTQAHLIQQAQMARMQAQRHQHTQVYIENFLNAWAFFAWAIELISKFRNIEFHHVVKQ